MREREREIEREREKLREREREREREESARIATLYVRLTNHMMHKMASAVLMKYVTVKCCTVTKKTSIAQLKYHISKQCLIKW